MSDLLYWVWFQIFFGYGTIRSHEVFEEYSSPDYVYQLILKKEMPQAFLKEKEKVAFPTSMEKAKQIVEITHKKKCNIITPDMSEYPPLLHHIYGKPMALYVKGSLESLKVGKNFTVVGTRNFSNYGERITQEIVANLALQGSTIVSGLANGIDSIALETAIQNDGNTIGVLACGLDYDYPKNSADLKRKVVEHGAVITEYPMGVKPSPTMFSPRNRIMSGMTDGALIIEAGEKSGALVTAQHSFDNNRDVFVVPGEAFAGTFVGSHRLIREGIGTLVTSVGDIFAHYPNYATKIDMSDNKTKSKTLPQGMDSTVYSVYECITTDNIQTANQIADNIDENISSVMSALTTLELLGFVVGKPGGLFTLSKS